MIVTHVLVCILLWLKATQLLAGMLIMNLIALVCIKVFSIQNISKMHKTIFQYS